MRHIYIIVVCAVALVASGELSAQAEPIVAPSSRLIVPVSYEDLMEKYGSFDGAITNMNRQEWAVMRAWSGYDELAAREVIHANKLKSQEKLADHSSIMMRPPGGGCDCWIEPDASYTTITTFDWDYTAGAGANVDCSIGPLALEFDFEFYGETYNEFYINSKGGISFGNYLIDWTPEEFPASNQVDQIVGFWADADYRATGDIKYKITPEAVYVNFVDVGYYNNHSDKKNSYQIIITPTQTEVLPTGFNSQLCYLDMAWTHGDVGGGGGCCGGTPANVGADKSTSSGAHIQYGRFNFLTDEYNGPYGSGDGFDDGVDWLDGKTFNFTTVTATTNIPPLPSGNLGCDTLTICLGSEIDIDLDFLAPESDQTITVSSTDANGWAYTTEDGSTGNISGVFTGAASNVGVQTFTITATDDGDPIGITSFDVIIEVLPVELPDLEITGLMVICSGAETTISATEGFDSYEWSNGSEEQTTVHTFGGTFYVSAYVDACAATELYTIEQTPYFIPDIDIVPPAICPGQTAIVTVDEEEQENYDEYEWIADWNGLGGEVVTWDGPEAEVTAGTYGLIVMNDEGCQGQRVFNVEQVGSFIPDASYGPYCDGIEDLVFEGGYASPEEGVLLVYLFSNDEQGWGGSYLELIFNGDIATSYILTSAQDFEQFEFDLFATDEMEINFISDGSVDPEFLAVSVYNCGFVNLTSLDDLEPGQVFWAESMCNSEPALGEWYVASGPAGYNFTVTDEYNTVFTPGDYGMYDVCFTDEVCETDYCYEVEITEAPEVSLNETDLLLCDGQGITLTAELTDIGGTASIDWPAPGTDDVIQNTYSYNESGTTTLTVNVENGCGTASASVEIESQYEPDPSLEDAILCDGGTVVLDPIDNLSDDLEFFWTLDGNQVGDDSPTYEAAETGEVCVLVMNDCHPAGVEACADLTIIEAMENPFDEQVVDCNGTGTGVVYSYFPEGYTVVWPDGSVGLNWDVIDEGPYDGQDICITVTDAEECNTEEFCTNLWIGVPPSIVPEPFQEVEEWLTLCPEVEYDFDLNAQNAVEYHWFMECDTVEVWLSSEEATTVVSGALPIDCWEMGLTLHGAAINPCGQAEQTWNVILEPCLLTIPNVFTPGNGDDLNYAFEVEGLNVYDNVILRVFNRWGDQIYESLDYRSGDWLADGVGEGTYWYVLLLPNGIDHTGHLTILR